MVSKILDVKILEDLVQKCLEMEKISETSDLWKIYEATENTEVKGLLFDLKIDSEHHFHELVDVAEEIDMDVSEDDLQRKAQRKSLIKEGMDLVDVLSQLKRHDENCKDFYSRIAESLRRSMLDDVDTESIADKFTYLSNYEERHIEELEKQIQKLQSPL